MKTWHILGIGLVLLALFCVVLSEHEDEENPTLANIYINTENGNHISSHEYYSLCTISADNTENGSFDFTDLTGKVRGRGNTSWSGGSIEMAKKGYKLVFDQPVDLLGYGESSGSANATEWALVGNYTDPSLSRSLWAYNLASHLGLKYTTVAQPVNLYLNGIYEGVYNLCDHYEISEHSIDIKPNDGTIDIGYVIERDSWQYSQGKEGETFFRIDVDGGAYAFSDPTYNLITDEQAEYIIDYFQKCLEAVYGNDFSQIESLLDLDTFAQCYIIHEVMSCQDVHGTSFYFYKDGVAGKLSCGPVWDFDNSAGNIIGGGEDTGRLWAREKSDWYRPLLEFQEFRDLVKYYLETEGWEQEIRTHLDYLKEWAYDHSYDFEYNFKRWNTMASMIWLNTSQFLSMREWSDHIEYLHSWINAKLDTMVEIYCS